MSLVKELVLLSEGAEGTGPIDPAIFYAESVLLHYHEWEQVFKIFVFSIDHPFAQFMSLTMQTDSSLGLEPKFESEYAWPGLVGWWDRHVFRALKLLYNLMQNAEWSQSETEPVDSTDDELWKWRYEQASYLMREEKARLYHTVPSSLPGPLIKNDSLLWMAPDHPYLHQLDLTPENARFTLETHYGTLVAVPKSVILNMSPQTTPVYCGPENV